MQIIFVAQACASRFHSAKREVGWKKEDVRLVWRGSAGLGTALHPAGGGLAIAGRTDQKRDRLGMSVSLLNRESGVSVGALDPIADIDLGGSPRNHRDRRVLLDLDHDQFAQNLTWYWRTLSQYVLAKSTRRLH